MVACLHVCGLCGVYMAIFLVGFAAWGCVSFSIVLCALQGVQDRGFDTDTYRQCTCFRL